MDYWSVEKKDINPFVIAPTLQYSNTPILIEIESYHDAYLLFAYRSVILWQLLRGSEVRDSQRN